MRYLFILSLFLFTQCTTPEELGPEIFLGSYTVDVGEIAFTELKNVTKNPGYDNQPSFTADGEYLLFSSTRKEQTDILKYHVTSGKKEWLSDTEGSEYSPILMPSGTTVSSILLKLDGEQLLWSYPFDTGESSVLIPEEVIGYHTWYDENSLYAFVLGDSTNPNSTLVRFDTGSGERTILAERIGRSLHRIPGSNSISFIDKTVDDWTINSYNHETGEINILAEALPGVEDMAWLTPNTVLMGSGSSLWVYNLNNEYGWLEVANLAKYGLNSISRLAVHPETNRIAIVSTVQEL